ncbi:MAG: hypothetical protein E6Q75_07780 [Rheinheimera sp.]|nr:MAG: hypothetical protein E6Q75_07780 [Rheinheimera sp.]
MKNLRIAIVLSAIVLSSCGGSEGNSDNETLTNEFQAKLSNTSWEKGCSVYNKFLSDDLKDAWNVKIKLSIDSSLEATYRTEYFHPNDTECNSMMFDALDVSRFDIRGKVISEESIDANALNEIFIYKSGGRELTLDYTLIYIDGERLYFGQSSAQNSGKTLETRHSSISLNNYFRKIIK